MDQDFFITYESDIHDILKSIYEAMKAGKNMDSGTSTYFTCRKLYNLLNKLRPDIFNLTTLDYIMGIADTFNQIVVLYKSYKFKEIPDLVRKLFKDIKYICEMLRIPISITIIQLKIIIFNRLNGDIIASYVEKFFNTPEMITVEVIEEIWKNLNEITLVRNFTYGGKKINLDNIEIHKYVLGDDYDNILNSINNGTIETESFYMINGVNQMFLTINEARAYLMKST